MKHKISTSQRFVYGYIQFVEHFLGKKRGLTITNGARKRFYKKLHNDLKNKGEGKLVQIERRKNLSVAEFKKHYLKKGIPVVMEGFAKDWGCCKEWSLDFFKENYGDDTITILDQNTQDMAYERIKLRDVLDDIANKGKKYLRFYPFLFTHPERISDFDYDWLQSMRNSGTYADAFQVFIGGKDRTTPMHNASQGNLFIQAFGEKKWIIYPPQLTAIVDPEPTRNMYRNAPFKTKEGPFNPHEPNFETPYTLFKYIDGYETTLKPGDVLWNPPFYWHTIKNPTDCIGISYKWIAPFYNFKMAPLYYFLELFSTKPTIWKSYKLFKKEFNLVNIAEKGRLKKYKQEVASENK